MIKIRIIGLICFMSLYLQTKAQSPNDGKWQGNIQYSDQQVSFIFELDIKSNTVTIINGEERKKINGVQITGDSIFIPLGVFDAQIKAKFTSKTMTGVWRKNYRKSSIPFSAFFERPRFDKKLNPTSINVPNQLKITFNPPEALAYPGVGIFNQEGNYITATVLTEVSDFRYFEGIVYGDSIKLTSFDGAHAFLMIGTKTESGWSGIFYFGDNYIEPWTAVNDPEASLSDPWQMVTVEEGRHRPFFDILAAGSGKNTIDESKYFNKVLVIQLFGTWCPNSLDQTNYLIDWYKNNSTNDVEILAVAFEPNYSKAYGLERIEAYKIGLDIPYDMALGGRLSKGQAAVAFPFMEKIAAFPTLVILDKNGFVRYINSYFNGPATGAYYQEFIRSFNQKINELLKE